MAIERWFAYGHELRRQRQLAGLTQRQLASRVKLSHGMVGAMERATRQPTKDYSDLIDAALDTGGILTRMWQDVAGTRDVPDWFRDALALERNASDIMGYDPVAIPGLLQKEGYARVLDTDRRVKADPEGVERVVKTRTERLPAVLEHGTIPVFVVPESVLRRQVGSPEVMATQLAHIADSADNGKIVVQVLPESAPTIAFTLPFRVMRLARQTVAYAEHADGGTLVHDPGRVEALVAKFTKLLAESLPPADSIRLIRKVKDDVYEIQLMED